MKKLNAIHRFLQILEEELQTRIDFGPIPEEGSLLGYTISFDELNLGTKQELNDAILRAAGVKK